MKSGKANTEEHRPRDPWFAFVQKVQSSLKLAEIVGGDFDEARNELARHDCGYTRRNVVRCFGPLIDVFAQVLRDLSPELGKPSEKTQNQFLREKSNSRGATASFRVKLSYKLVANVLPLSTFAKINYAQWERLHLALEVRNRILHPNDAQRMIVSDADLQSITACANDFLNDFATFLGLCELRSKELYQSTHMQRLRRLGTFRVSKFQTCSKNGIGRNSGLPMAA